MKSISKADLEDRITMLRELVDDIEFMRGAEPEVVHDLTDTLLAYQSLYLEYFGKYFLPERNI